MIAVLFILILPFIASIKYRYVSIYAFLCITIYLELPPGWYAGANRVIEIFIVAIIAIVVQLCFEYYTSIFRMQSVVLYLLEVISDGFYAFTADDTDNVDKKIYNKYLFERPLSFKADFAIEKIYKSNREKFVHRMLMELVNRGKLVDVEEYFFIKNREYKNYAYSLFVLCKRMVSSTSKVSCSGKNFRP